MIGKEELAMATLDSIAVSHEHPTTPDGAQEMLRSAGLDPTAAMGFAALFAETWLEIRELKHLTEEQMLRAAIAEAFMCGARAARAERIGWDVPTSGETSA